MSVTEVGTPSAPAAFSGSNSGSVTGSWSGSQPRTAGHLLEAKVTAWGSTTAGTISTPSGWTLQKAGVSSTGRSRVAIYTKEATGSDTAPTFTATMTGTGSLSRMYCYLKELTGQDATTPVPSTGHATGTSSIPTLTSDSAVPSAGCYVDAVWNVGFNTTMTVTIGAAGGVNVDEADTGATSARAVALFSDVANPTSGSTITSSLSLSGGTTNEIDGVLIIVQPTTATPVAITGVSAAISLPGGVGTLKVGRKVAGVASAVAVAGGIGTPKGSSKIAAGVGAAITFAGTAGLPVTPSGVHIPGVAAQISVDAGIGLNIADVKVQVAGVAAAITFAGGIGVPTIIAPYVHVPGVAAEIIFEGGLGKVEVLVPFRLAWDSSNPNYSQGVSNGVLYPKFTPGVSWSGLISVLESGEDAPTPMYIDGQKYRDESTPSTFGGTISAFMYPDEFEPYIGLDNGLTAQNKDFFGLSYRTNNELHLVYNVMVAPSSDQYSSLGDTVSPVAFSWAFETVPVDIPSGRPTSHIVVMLDVAEAGAISDLEAILYGDDMNEPALPDPATVYSLFETYTTLTITDNGDGTWTADGPSSAITMLDDTTFQIDWPSALFVDSDSYQIYSL